MADKDSEEEQEVAPQKKKITLKPAGFKASSETMGTPPRSDPNK